MTFGDCHIARHFSAKVSAPQSLISTMMTTGNAISSRGQDHVLYCPRKEQSHKPALFTGLMGRMNVNKAVTPQCNGNGLGSPS